MKKIAAFAVCLLVLAAIVRGIASGAGFGPTILTVAVETSDGTPATHSVRILVGALSETDLRAPTLGNVTLIQPKGAGTFRYEVPFDREIAVFVIESETKRHQFNFRLSGGEERTETIVLGQ